MTPRLALLAAALVALAASAAAQPNLQFSAVSGKAGSLAPPSSVGIWVPITDQAEYSSLIVADPGFFSKFGFSGSVVNSSGILERFTVSGDGNIEFIPGATGDFRVYVCNSKVKGQAQTAGTFLAEVGLDEDAYQVPIFLSQSVQQAYKTKSAKYLAVVLFDASGNVFTSAAGGGRFVLKLDVGASGLNPAFVQPKTATSTCGFKSLKIA